MWPFAVAAGGLGARGERCAARFLRRRGFRIVVRSYRCDLGEIDLVAEHRGAIVFVEVKTRSSGDHGEPWQAVDRVKQRRITRLATYFLTVHRLQDRPVRFDVIGVTWAPGWFGRPQIEHFEAAYEAVGPWSV